MNKRRMVYFISVVCIITFFIGASVNILRIKNEVNGDSEENMKRSIAYLHGDYIKNKEDITIVDQFTYESKKVVLFNCNDMSGIAKFNKSNDGKFEIAFVETLDSKEERQVSNKK